VTPQPPHILATNRFACFYFCARTRFSLVFDCYINEKTMRHAVARTVDRHGRGWAIEGSQMLCSFANRLDISFSIGAWVHPIVLAL
jgi:hypothetical protein